MPWEASARASLPVALGARIAHVHAFTLGRTAQEFEPRGNAAAEVEQLYRLGAQRAPQDRREPVKKGKLAMLPPRPAAKVTLGRIGEKGVLTQLDLDTARRLKMLAVEHDTTRQALGEGAFAALLERYGG